MTKEVALNATVPQLLPRTPPPQDKKDAIMEIVLASLPISAKGDSKGADQGSLEAAAQQTKVFPPGKIVIKKK